MLNYITKLFVPISMSILPMLSFAIDNNDFTGRNEDFNARSAMKSSRFNNEKTNFDSKPMEQKMFSTPTNLNNLTNKKSWLENNDSAKSLLDKNLSGFSDTFKSKRFKGMSGSWGGSKEAIIKNSENNLSKEYKGKIDIYKRDVDKQKMIDRYYETISDRSFDELNRYYSKNSRTEGEREFLRKAGGDIHEDDSSFFDIFLSKEHIARQPVVWKKVNRDSIKKMQGNAENQSQRPVSNDGVLGVYQNGNFTVPSSAENQNAQQQQVQKANIAERIEQIKAKRKGYQETEIDSEVAKRAGFLKLPDEFRAKATIKVEIKDSGF